MNSDIQDRQEKSFIDRLRKNAPKHPLVFYFFFAYLISWLLSIPYILGEWGILHGNFAAFFVIKSFGPFLSAMLMYWLMEGKEGLKKFKLLNRPKKVAWFWYLVVLLVIPALLMVAILFIPGATTGYLGFKPLLTVTYIFTFIAVFFGGGPLGEEPGWRGFALPRLQKQSGPFWGTLILGLLWTCWHLPDFLTSAQGGGPGTGLSTFLANFPVFLFLVMALAINFTWIYNRTRDSVFMALLAHASVNTPQVVLVPLFPNLSVTGLNTAAVIAFGIPALLLLIFTKGSLGYAAEQMDQIPG